MKLLIEIPDYKLEFALEFFKSISFVKNVKTIEPNEITNPAILNSIEDYEKGRAQTTPMNLAELKNLIDAWPSFYAKSLERFGMVDEKWHKICLKDLQSFRKTCKTPFEGLGQPEMLKSNYSGYWSRRINLEHRIIYKVEVAQIVVVSLFGHYQ